MNFSQQIIHLSFDRTDFYAGIQQACRTDNLLRHIRLHTHFITTRRSGNINDLIDSIRKFLKSQGTVIQRAWQTEPIIHKRVFSRLVSIVHGMKLRYGNMGFINHNHIVIRKIIKQCIWRVSRPAIRHMARIIFDT